MINSNRYSLKPIGRIRVTEEVVDRILSLIQDGHLKEGDKLPSQKELVELLKVSRPSLREAISGLVMLGILEAKAGQGIYVRNVQLDRGVDLSGALTTNQDEMIGHLYEMRIIIETAAARLASQRATKEEIQALYSYVDLRRSENPEAIAKVYERELLFHQMLVDAAHNPVLSQYESNLLSEFSKYLSLIYTEPTSAEWDMNTQREIIKKIELHDEAGAAQAVKEHIEPFAKELLGQES